MQLSHLLLISLCDCFVNFFCMTANRTVNAIILVQRGFCWKNECEFLQVPLPLFHKRHRLYISAARVLKTESEKLCVQSSDNKLGLPSTEGAL